MSRRIGFCTRNVAHHRHMYDKRDMPDIFVKNPERLTQNDDQFSVLKAASSVPHLPTPELELLRCRHPLMFWVHIIDVAECV